MMKSMPGILVVLALGLLDIIGIVAAFSHSFWHVVATVAIPPLGIILGIAHLLGAY